jgi:flavodoxin
VETIWIDGKKVKAGKRGAFMNIIEIDYLTKRFGGINAVEDISFNTDLESIFKLRHNPCGISKKQVSLYMVDVLITFHSQTGNTERLAKAVSRGVDDTENSGSTLKRAIETTADDIRRCDAIIICSPEYFGYMAGAIKDLFDRTYEELKDDRAVIKKPYAIAISAGNDGTGALFQIERILKGYRLKRVQPPIICIGEPDDEILLKCYELGRTVAEGVNARIF